MRPITLRANAVLSLVLVGPGLVVATSASATDESAPGSAAAQGPLTVSYLPSFAPGGECWANGINDAGTVVGTCVAAESFREIPVTWVGGKVKPLATWAGRGYATAIDEQGRVTGRLLAADGRWHAVLWSGGEVRDLGAPDLLTEGRSISKAGVVGSYAAVTGASTRAFRWSGGRLKALPGGEWSVAEGINDAGVVVGVAGLGDKPDRAFVLRNGVMTYPPVGAWSHAYGVNDAGHVVGKRTVSGGFVAPFFVNGASARTLRAHGLLNPVAVAVNDRDVIVGNSDYQYNTYPQAALLWRTPGSLPIRLPQPAAAPVTAEDVNNSGTVVGYETTYPTGYPHLRAVIWR